MKDSHGWEIISLDIPNSDKSKVHGALLDAFD
jgi:hypothetical protein